MGERRGLVVLLILLPATAAALWLFWPRSAAPPERFLAHRGRIHKVEATDSLTAEGRTLRTFAIESTTGLHVRGLLSIPEGPGPFPAVILQGGLTTSSRALLLVPHPGSRVLASMEYPYRMPRRAGFFKILRELPRMRESTDKAVAGLLLVHEYLESLPWVDSGRTIIVGGSLGVPFATLAGALEPGFEGVALLYGGGDLVRIAEARLPFESPVKRWISRTLLRPWLDPVDPARFVSRIAPRPVLLVNGRRDIEIPAASVTRLHVAARDPKTVVWVDTPHRVAGNAALADTVARVVWDWMETQGL